MAAPFPESLGFRVGDRGTHTSRTLMLKELTALLAVCPSEATRDDYWRAVVEENVLDKATASTRRWTAQRLSELYALDLSAVIFRGLRFFRDRDPNSVPLLALLCGLARDPLLRNTIDGVIDLEPGSSFDRDRVRDALSRSLNDRLNDRVLDKVVRNAASSWTQAGHLAGRTFKKRQRVDPTPGPAAMALLLGYLQGVRGFGLLKTIWCRALDASPEAMANLASKGRALGLLKFRKAGEVVDVEFPDLVSSHELTISYEPH